MPSREENVSGFVSHRVRQTRTSEADVHEAAGVQQDADEAGLRLLDEGGHLEEGLVLVVHDVVDVVGQRVVHEDAELVEEALVVEPEPLVEDGHEALLGRRPREDREALCLGKESKKR
jgi:hypothetical protein